MIFPISSIFFLPLKYRFLAVLRGPGGFRELREAGRIHFHLSWYLSDYVVTSYDQNPPKGTNNANKDFSEFVIHYVFLILSALDAIIEYVRSKLQILR